jgi:sugar/nucleoside kinase (ribokinase family)
MATGVFVGLSTIDVIYATRRFPHPNGKTVANSQEVQLGGPATTAALAFSHLGGDAILVSAVGKHPLAAMVKTSLDHFSVRHIDLNEDFEDIPAVSSIIVLESGERSIISANATRIPCVRTHANESAFREGRSSVLLTDGHSMDACIAWARTARAKGVSVVFDGGSWKDGTEVLLRDVDIAILSATFRPPECGQDSNSVMAYVAACGVRHVAVTDGANPVLFATEGSIGTMPVRSITAVNTSGAGDVLHGAFCFHYARARNFVGALHYSTKIATESCEKGGPGQWMRRTQYQSNVKMSSPGRVQSVAMTRVPPRSTVTSSPHSEEENPTRREFWEFCTAIGTLSLAAITGYDVTFGKKIERAEQERLRLSREKAVSEKEEAALLLKRYCHPAIGHAAKSDLRIPLIPALDDPFGPRERRFSASGALVSAAYIAAFNDNRIFEVAEPADVDADDSPIAVSSHLVNGFAQRYFSNGGYNTPNHWVRYHDERGGYFEVELRWAVFDAEGDGKVTLRQPFEDRIVDRVETVHHISDLEEKDLHSVNFSHQTAGRHTPINDYLLLTVLPRDYRRDRRFISLAGLYRPGTLAAQKFFLDPPLEVLRNIANTVGGIDFFQALISVEVDSSNPDDSRPKSLTLKGVCPLTGIRVVPPSN